MGLAKLKVFILEVRMEAFAVTMALMQMKNQWMEIGFIQKRMVFLETEERSQKGWD